MNPRDIAWVVVIAVGLISILFSAYSSGRKDMCKELCQSKGTPHYLVTDKYKCQCMPVHKLVQP